MEMTERFMKTNSEQESSIIKPQVILAVEVYKVQGCKRPSAAK